MLAPVVGDLSQNILCVVLIALVQISSNIFFYGLGHTIAGRLSQKTRCTMLITLV